MKVLLLLFFTFTAPLALFLATVMYSVNSTVELKKSLAESGVYAQIHSYLVKKDAEAEAADELFATLVSSRFTAGYIQVKTEGVLDDANNWVIGKSKTPPSVSFKELRDDMVSNHPELLQYLENLPKYAKADQEGIDPEQKARIIKEAENMSSFVKNDFTIPLGNYLQGMKDAYRIFQIALPIWVILLIASLFSVYKLAGDQAAKWKWLGATFMTSALWGFGIIFFNRTIATSIEQLNHMETSSYMALLAPILMAVMRHYVENYTSYQGVMSVVLLLVAAGCFLISSRMKTQTVPAANPKK